MLDLRKVKVPIYNLATREDHIAPAKSVLFGSQYFGGPVKYVLAGSGHIAGVVNPPGKPKYQYWTGGKPGGADLDAWMAKATEHPGSWWPDWLEWLKDARRRDGAGARHRRRQAQADRGRAGVIRESEKLGLTRGISSTNLPRRRFTQEKGLTMSRELMWLTLTVILTGLMWVPTSSIASWCAG